MIRLQNITGVCIHHAMGDASSQLLGLSAVL